MRAEGMPVCWRGLMPLSLLGLCLLLLRWRRAPSPEPWPDDY
jgi:hypothetical protein